MGLVIADHMLVKSLHCARSKAGIKMEIVKNNTDYISLEKKKERKKKKSIKSINIRVPPPPEMSPLEKGIKISAENTNYADCFNAERRKQK